MMARRAKSPAGLSRPFRRFGEREIGRQGPSVRGKQRWPTPRASASRSAASLGWAGFARRDFSDAQLKLVFGPESEKAEESHDAPESFPRSLCFGHSQKSACGPAMRACWLKRRLGMGAARGASRLQGLRPGALRAECVVAIGLPLASRPRRARLDE